MSAKLVQKVLLLFSICLISLNLSEANPLQHLSEIDLQDTSLPRIGKQYTANYYNDQDDVENDYDSTQDEIKAIPAEQVSPIISGMLG